MADPPRFAPFPPANFRKDVIPEEWEACLDSWITLAQAHLRLSAQHFTAVSQKDATGLITFLASYFEEFTTSPSAPGSESNVALRKSCFLLTHRLLSEAQPPEIMLHWQFLADFCHSFPRSQELRKLLSSVWTRKGAQIENSIQQSKETLIKGLDSGKIEEMSAILSRLLPLLHASSSAACFFMIGSDLLDSLAVAHLKMDSNQRRITTLFSYLSLVSLALSEKPNFSLLLDHLYGLKSSSPTNPGQQTLLSDLVSITPLLQQITKTMTGQESGRAQKLEQTLSEYRQSNITRPKRPIRRKIDKGKGKATDEHGHGAFGEFHIHRMSLITQVQDLFPELGAAYVMKLLDEYSEDVEQVTAHLLDDSLPEHLRNADRTEELPQISHPNKMGHGEDLIPKSTPPERRNVFDNDEFDQLAVDTSRLHLGRKNAKLTADDVLADRSTAPNKAAILSALAGFDSDDDERDDTYDVEDVGGTVDSTFAGNGDVDVDKNEEALFMAHRMNPDAFKRDTATRRGKARLALKSETGMTDEAIEGWAIMTARDPRTLRRLEAKYATFAGQQRELERTSYRESAADSGTESDRNNGGRVDPSGRGRGRGRGGGGYGGRGGGNVAGPASDADTQKARQRKDASKGSRANHNRRDQRAKKMARGGFPG